MSLEDWQTFILITFGMLLGFIAGLLSASYVLPIAVGDGWWNVIGAFIGVMGAFLAAWASFVWNEQARKKEIATPLTRRQDDSAELLDECISLFREIRDPLGVFAEKALQECEIHQKLVTISLPVFSEHNDLHAEQAKDVSRYKEEVSAVTSQAAANIKVQNLAEIISRLENVSTALSWILSNMEDVITPTQIRLIKSTVDNVMRAKGCTTLIMNVLEDYQRYMVRQNGKVMQIKAAMFAAPLKLETCLEDAKQQLMISRD